MAMMTVSAVHPLMLFVVIEIQEDDFLSVIDGGYDLIDRIVDALISAFCGVELHDVLFQRQSLLAACQVSDLIHKLSGFLTGDKAGSLNRIHEYVNLGTGELPILHVILIAPATVNHDLIAPIVQEFDILINGRSVCLDPALGKHGSKLLRPHRVISIGFAL